MNYVPLASNIFCRALCTNGLAHHCMMQRSGIRRTSSGARAQSADVIRVKLSQFNGTSSENFGRAFEHSRPICRSTGDSLTWRACVFGCVRSWTSLHPIVIPPQIFFSFCFALPSRDRAISRRTSAKWGNPWSLSVTFFGSFQSPDPVVH